MSRLNSFSLLGMGWSTPPSFVTQFPDKPGCAFWNLVCWVFGVAATAFAASLGGAYWFKLLGDVIRLTGYRPATSGQNKK